MDNNLRTTKFQEAIREVIAIYMKRGSKINKAKGKSTVPAREKMQKHIDVWGITDKQPGDAYTVTLARIAGCFPRLCAKILASKLVAPIGNTRAPDLPVYLSFPGAPALMTDRSLKEQWFTWSRKFSELIGAVPDEKKMAQVFEATFSSPLYSSVERATILQELKDMDNANK
jgi:hypothetical protein